MPGNAQRVLPVIGFAGYGVSCLGEKMRGHHLTSEAEDILNNLWIHSKQKSFRYILKHKNIKKIEHNMKPYIVEAVLKHALQDVENNEQGSVISKLLEEEAALVMKRLEHLGLQ